MSDAAEWMSKETLELFEDAIAGQGLDRRRMAELAMQFRIGLAQEHAARSQEQAAVAQLEASIAQRDGVRYQRWLAVLTLLMVVATFALVVVDVLAL